MKKLLAALCVTAFAPLAAAQVACPDKNVNYWQAFPPGGESDLSARHQQVVLKAKCPTIDTIIQYKAGAGGGLMWSQMNQLAGDGLNIVGVNLPHIVFQPIEGQVSYKTEDVTPVFWFHYTPDALVVPEQSLIKTFADFVATARADPGKVSLGGSGLNSANHAAHAALVVDREGRVRHRTADLLPEHGGRHVVHGLRDQQQGPRAPRGWPN